MPVELSLLTKRLEKEDNTRTIAFTDARDIRRNGSTMRSEFLHHPLSISRHAALHATQFLSPNGLRRFKNTREFPTDQFKTLAGTAINLMSNGSKNHVN